MPVTEQEQPGGSAPPGWYADPNGQMRWWDGQQWGQVAAPTAPAAASSSMDPKSMAVLAEVLGIFTGFVGPLIIYIVNGDKDPFVRHHASESLNFHITLFIGYMVSFVLMIVLIGFVTFFVIWIVGLIFMIQASMAASRGEWYRYPINIRFVSGAVGG
jgi:uncharacterized Tic20 family protein